MLLCPLLSFWPGKSHRSPGERGEGTGEDAKWAVKLETHAEGGGGREEGHGGIYQICTNIVRCFPTIVFFNKKSYLVNTRLRMFYFWVKALTERHHNSHFSPTYISCVKFESPPSPPPLLSPSSHYAGANKQLPKN